MGECVGKRQRQRTKINERDDSMGCCIVSHGINLFTCSTFLFLFPFSLPLSLLLLFIFPAITLSHTLTLTHPTPTLSLPLLPSFFTSFTLSLVHPPTLPPSYQLLLRPTLTPNYNFLHPYVSPVRLTALFVFSPAFHFLLVSPLPFPAIALPLHTQSCANLHYSFFFFSFAFSLFLLFSLYLPLSPDSSSSLRPVTFLPLTHALTLNPFNTQNYINHHGTHGQVDAQL